jgi:mitochondrial fission protein ELM1
MTVRQRIAGLPGAGGPTYSYADLKRGRDLMDRDQSSSDRASPETPRTWLLASPHQGDNTQLQALADALGWPFEIKRLAYQPHQTLARLTLGATLLALDRQRSSPIAPPWPDLVIGAGRPTEAIALWLRRHANPNVRLVYLGTPWASLDRFDLVVTTPQYRLPARANVLHNSLPLHGLTRDRLATAAAAWQPRLEPLPRPWIALLVGGPSGPYTFDTAAATRLGGAASALAGGGALLVATSARTPASVAAALEAAIAVPSHFFRWTSGPAANPFLGFLALADQFIVTADSISMIAEACATGKPVRLFDIESGPQSMRAACGWRGRDLNSTLWRLLLRAGPAKWSRDLTIVHRRLVAAGRASWLGEAPQPLAVADDRPDLERTIARVRALFDR